MLTAELLILQFALPSDGLWPFAVLLLDPRADRLYVRGRADFGPVDPKDARILKLLLVQISQEADEASGSEILAHLEDVLSNSVRISERRRVYTSNIARSLEELADRELRTT